MYIQIQQDLDHGLNNGNAGPRVMLFKHDYTSSNVLQPINTASDVIDGTMIEIVLTGQYSSS